MKVIKVVLAVFVVFLAINAYSAMISLEEYMALVEANNPQMQALNESIKSAKTKAVETQRAIEPFVLSGSGNYTEDKLSGLSSDLMSLKSSVYNIGITKRFATGTGITIGGTNIQTVANSKDSAIGRIDSQTLAPFVSVDQSLWKDFVFGASWASLKAAQAAAKANLYTLEYSKQNFIIAAKSAYWAFSYAKTNTAYRKASAARYQELLEWNTRRFNLDLAERADLLQSQASQKSSELNLKLANNNYAQAKRAFNQYINVSPDLNEYDVPDFDEAIKGYTNMKEIHKKGTRFDTLAALENAKAATESAKAAKRNAGLDVVASGKYTANGSGKNFSDAQTDAQKDTKPVYVVGLSITIPLDFINQINVYRTYNASSLAAQKSADAAIATEATDWQNLLDTWQIDLVALEMSQSIKNFQEQYLLENRKLLKRGRTTTNVLIQSEEAFDNAVLNFYQTTLTLIMDYEKAITYYNNQEAQK